MNISFSNGLYMQPVNATYKTNNNTRGTRSKYIGYYCPICKINHWRLMSESYLIKGEWYCKESIDKLLRGDECN